jgi:hypothetical protein
MPTPMPIPLNEVTQSLISLFIAWLKPAYAVEINGAFLSYPEVNNRTRIVESTSVVAIFFDAGQDKSTFVTVEDLRNGRHINGEFQLPNNLKIKRLFGEK